MTEKVQILQTHVVLMKHSMISEDGEKEAAQELHSKWPYSSLKFLTNTSDYLTSNQMKCSKNWRHFSSALKIAVKKGNVHHVMELTVAEENLSWMKKGILWAIILVFFSSLSPSLKFISTQDNS